MQGPFVLRVHENENFNSGKDASEARLSAYHMRAHTNTDLALLRVEGVGAGEQAQGHVRAQHGEEAREDPLAELQLHHAVRVVEQVAWCRVCVVSESACVYPTQRETV